MEQLRRFRLRSPGKSMENWEVIPGKEAETWDEVLTWIKHVKPERLHSFRLQINYRKDKNETK